MNRLQKKVAFLVVLSNSVSTMISYTVASIGYLLIIKGNIAFFRDGFAYDLVIFLFMALVTSGLFVNRNSQVGERNLLQEYYNCVSNQIAILIGITILFFLFRIDPHEISRGVILIAVMLGSVISFLGRIMIRRQLQHISIADHEHMLIVIKYDSLVNRKDEFEEIALNPSLECALVVADQNLSGQVLCGMPVVADFDHVASFAQRNVVDSVLIVLENGWWKKIEEQIFTLQSMGITIHLSSDFISGFPGFSREVGNFSGLPVISYASHVDNYGNELIKRSFDIIGSFIGCTLTLLLTPFIALLIKIDSPGPVFFKQMRVGKNGRYFEIYKFRSMVSDAELRKKDLESQNELKGHMFKMTKDPRVTRVGKVLRATSLDEFPQFLNVLKGDMSLVGTRPPTIDEYSAYKAHHKRRLSIKPGLTGLWQVSGRSKITDFEEVVKYDLEYVDHQSLLLDLKIIAKTFIVVLIHLGSF